MKAVRIEDDTMPQNPGEYSLQHDMYRPPYGKRDEIFMMTPLHNVGALIPENHTWTLDPLNVTPSIVYFDYHGFVTNGEWVLA